MTVNQTPNRALNAALASLQAKRQSLKANQADVTPAVPATQQMSLDLWPDSVCGVPNAFLRGALFGVSQRREVARKRELLA